jgi:hypothetical protein
MRRPRWLYVQAATRADRRTHTRKHRVEANGCTEPARTDGLLAKRQAQRVAKMLEHASAPASLSHALRFLLALQEASATSHVTREGERTSRGEGRRARTASHHS